jgi:hypothetical protein
LVCIKSLTCNLFDLSFSSATIAIAAVLATSVVGDDVTPGFISPMAVHAAVEAVRSRNNQVAVFRLRGGEDRLVGMLMLELNPLAYDACCSGRADSGAKSFLGMLLHTCLVLSGRVLDHLREIDLVSFPQKVL